MPARMIPSAVTIHSGLFSAKRTTVSPRLKPSLASPFAKDRAQSASFSKDQRCRSFLSNTISAVFSSCSRNESTTDCNVGGELTFHPRMDTGARVSSPSFCICYDFLGLDEAVRIYRDRVDTTFYQERG